jgi:bacterioferritin
MQGKKKVVDRLNRLLTDELSAADQYFVHSRMYENWGFTALYRRLEHERVEELDHASRLIRRILFLEGTPDVATRVPLKIGRSVPEMLKNDLDYELAVVGSLRKAIALCEEEKDFETRRILTGLLRDTEEDHAYWLEQQLRLIELAGLENYQQSAMREGEAS